MRILFQMVWMSSALVAFGLAGCSQNVETVATEEVNHEAHDHEAHDHEAHDHDAHDHEAHDHGGWWCVEHGVPEEECALCDTSLVADFKAKGDWCDEHARPESQCFTCNPDLLQKFAARYEAKFGEQPPPPTE